MIIYLPFRPKPTGGSSSFAQKFKLGMEKRGHTVSFSRPPSYDILFLIVQGPLLDVLDAKLHHKPVVQRLDGVNYWSVASWKFPFLNLKGFIIRHLFATFTIYQSAYSKYCCNLFLLPKLSAKSKIIYNGVDTVLFSPKGNKKSLRSNPDQQVFITVSDFRRLDQIDPLVKAVEYYNTHFRKYCKLVIIGNFRDKAALYPHQHARSKFLEFLGPVPNSDLPGYLRSSDLFLHSHLNPPCPNNVLEAMACGLPICGINDGAMSELVSSGKEGFLSPAQGNGFWKKRYYNIKNIAAQINLIMSQRNIMSEAARNNVMNNFNLEQMLDNYLDVFNHV